MTYPEDYVDKVLCGDCLTLMRDIPDGSIDLVLTDPPYNISQIEKKINRTAINNRKLKRTGKKSKELNYDFGKWDRYDDIDDMLTFTETWLNQIKRILKDNGQIISFFSKSEISFFEYLMGGIGLHVRQTLVWHKANPVPQIFKVGYMSATEFFTWATKNSGAGHTWNYKLAGQKHNVYEYPICQGNERTEHPTQKPVKLFKEILTYHTNKNDIVLDAFLGSGTTAVACKELHRHFIGIEISSHYCSLSEQRLANTTPGLF